VKDLDFDSKLFEEVSNKIILNYDLAETLVPEKLKKEFKKKVLPWKYIKEEIVPLLVRCRRLEIAGLQEQLKVILAARIGSQGFGARCEKLGRLPEEIYAELTRGLFVLE